MGDQAHSEVDNGTLWTELKHYSKHVTEGGVQTNKSLVQESLEESILKKKVFSLYVLDEGFISKTTNSPFWKFRAGNQQADEVNTNEVTGTDQGQNQPMPKADLVTTSTDVPEQNSPAATQEARAKILQLVRELHDLKECGALSNEEFEEKKGVILRDF